MRRALVEDSGLRPRILSTEHTGLGHRVDEQGNTLEHAFRRQWKPFSGKRRIARVAGSASSVESRRVRFIQGGSELQPPWQIRVG